ncbi:dihydrolipoyl dehydrogenase family protein [Georgenia yuyongxinii]|uniref:NAD(P)/FAD-dependent oxidoreductase n=1 Tax=Georgenia yuyongxinii TaxID=2589797 RepID=A0A552WW25_9MICO|nr:NAD(P)/FAD-dependent oxidoreductase [Georgenia yuyongxinii]TRW46503.1 NAD(P)/FAD-dependent oxidoreductase [Georgenia yuyongxinii]
MTGTLTERVVDVVVIGGGATGENVADFAHRRGLEVTLVERALLGGECSYYACMPSKALLRPGRVLAAARDVRGAAPAVGGMPDVAAVLARRTSFTHHWDDGAQVRWADGAGLDLVRGTARLDGERRVVVSGDDGEQVLHARHAVVLATGSVPTTPPVEGLPATRHWTTRDATSAPAVPRRLVVLGAGVAGAELSQAFARLGAAVSLVARSRVLAGFAPEVGERVARGLAGAGVDVHAGSSAVRAERPEGPDGPVVLHLENGTALVGDELLVATGRRPRTRGLGLETVGIDQSDGDPLMVDDSGRVTAVPAGWLYAAGDVTGRAPLTHQGKYAARAVGEVIGARAAGRAAGEPAPWSAHAATADHVAVPQVVFTDPEVAHVGLTAAAAREQGRPVRTVTADLADVAGASILADDYAGWAQLVVDDARDVILGATFVGPDVAELLHAATIAVVGEVPLERLWHAVPAYPTLSEVWLRLLDDDRERTA